MKKESFLFLAQLLLFTAAHAQGNVQQEGWYNEEWYGDEWYSDESCCLNEMNFSAKVLAGANFLQNTTTNGNRFKYQPGYIVAGSFGYSWNYGLSLEAEYAFRRNDIKKIQFFGEGSSKRGHTQVSSYMGNLLWDLPLSFWGCEFWGIRPFIGAGIGYDFQRTHSSNSQIIFDQKWKQFSWQAMAGLAYPIFCNAEATLEYKFHQGGSRFYHHSVGVGLIYKFGFFGL